MSAIDRIKQKIERIQAAAPDQASADRDIYRALDANEVLSVALLPVNSRFRNAVVNALRRAKARQLDVARLKSAAKEDELVPVEVHGGGKCKMTIYMTREAAEQHR